MKHILHQSGIDNFLFKKESQHSSEMTNEHVKVLELNLANENMDVVPQSEVS